MNTMIRSLHLKGSIAALLVASTLTSFGLTNSIPQEWDFEEYTNAVDNIADVTGTDGWYGDDTANVLIATNATYPLPSVGYPLPLSEHDYYAKLSGPVTNQITSEKTDLVWIDHMVKPEQWKQDEPPAVTNDAPDVQMAYYVNTNNHLVIYHTGVDTNGISTGSTWSEIDDIEIESNAWARISIGMNYNTLDGTYRYYQLRINSEWVEHTNAIVNPIFEPPTLFADWSGGGRYFRFAGNHEQLNAIVIKGTGDFDDFVVSTNTPHFDITHIIMSSVMSGASGGSLTPTGSIPVEEGSNQVFTVAVSNFWTIDKIVYVEDGNTMTNYSAGEIAFNTVTNDGSIEAYFTAQRDTNGVPIWWLDISGMDTNGNSNVDDTDGDGLTTMEEWLASTDPDGDSNSVLRISEAYQANGSNYVVWTSAHVDPELPAFSVMTSTNLLTSGGSGDFTESGTVMRGTVNTWSEEIPLVPTFYKVAATNAP